MLNLYRSYENATGDILLEKAEATVRELERKATELDETMRELNEEISKVEHDLNAADSRKRNLADNQRLRTIEATVQRLESEISSIDVAEAERAKRQFDTQYQKSEAIRDDKHGEVCVWLNHIFDTAPPPRRLNKSISLYIMILL